MSFSNSDIARYYELSESQYRWIWDLDKSMSLHYGYWDAYTKKFHEALLNINNVLSRKTGITDADVVLDAGCGIGGSSIWLALNKGCKVTGISLSGKQVEKARVLAAALKADTLVNFEQRDFVQTGFPDESFDVIWAIESVCHAENKIDFIREAYRLLKPGGRLIMADFFKVGGLKGEDDVLIKRWAHGWAVNDFSTIGEFKDGLEKTGFKNVSVEDATENILPSARRLNRAYWPGKILAMMYNLFHPRATGTGVKNLDTAKTQWRALRKGLWRYGIVYAEK